MTSRGPVVIAGGGIAGLAAAIALAKRDIASIVCERRSDFSESGAGIQIGPNGTRLLAGLGVAAHLQPFAAIPDGLNVMSGITGARLSRLPLGSWVAARHGAPYWTTHRKDVQTALLAVARVSPLIMLRTACDVRAWQQVGNGIAAQISGGETVTGRTLLIADGVRSRLRQFFGGRTELRATGSAALRGVVSGRAEGPAANDVHIWLGPGSHAVHYPVRRGNETAVVLITRSSLSADDWSVPVDVKEIRAIARSAPDALRQLIGRVGEWRQWPLVRSRHLQRWSDGSAALIGDAAHPILPYLAQGGVMAIEDAVTVAAALQSGDDDTAALARWALSRQHRVRRVQAAAESNGRIYHLDGLAARARDLALRSLSGGHLMSRYDWLYGWKPTEAER